MGILYSRSIGTLLSKGEYIFPLDNDDLFLDEDVFKTISNINDTNFQTHKPNLVLFQPELGKFPLKEGNTSESIFNDVYLWAKCIKTSLYKEALIKIGAKRISRYVLIFEDIYVNYVLFNIANSYKFINKYGLFRIKRKESASNIWGKYNEMNKSFLYLLL